MANTEFSVEKIANILGISTAFVVKVTTNPTSGNSLYSLPNWAAVCGAAETLHRPDQGEIPDIELANATRYSRSIPVFTYMDNVLRTHHADIIGEHFYDTPKWFTDNMSRSDHYDRKGPKIFVGEYAGRTDRVGSMKHVNNLFSALSEACFITGLARN